MPFTRFKKTACFSVQSSLSRHTSLRSIARNLASDGVDRLLNRIAARPLMYQAYDSCDKTAQRWFHMQAHSESLREVLYCGPIVDKFNLLQERPRQILHCCYFEQYTEAQVARVIGLVGPGYGHQEYSETLMRIRSAYRQLCRLLQEEFPLKTDNQTRRVEYNSVFPEPPGLRRRLHEDQRHEYDNYSSASP